MSLNMHKLLARQIKKYVENDITIDKIDTNILKLLEVVSQTYEENDKERKFLENTISINTQELNELLEERSSLLASRTQEKEDMINLLTQYRIAIDASLIVSMTNLKGIITYVNDNFCHISGYTKDELMGKSHNIVRHPDNSPELFKQMWETIQNKKIWTGVFPNLSKNKTTYYVQATIIPLLDKNGEIKEYMALREDITKQVVYQNELQEERQRISTIFNSQENMVLIVDKNQGVIEANQRFFETFNFKDLAQVRETHACMGQLFESYERNYKDNINSEVEWFEQFLEKNEQLHKLKRTDEKGNVQLFSVHCKTVILNNTTHYLATFTEITELENARQKALEAQKAKSAFLANMSHEIRTPLNAIIGFSDILCEAQIKNEDKENAKIISRSAKSLLNIINDVLDISKMENGKLELEQQSFSLFELTEHIVELFSINANDKKIKFLYSVDPKLPALIRSDATRLQQVISNLLSNAIKFTPQFGKVYFDIEVLNYHENEQKISIKFSVKDSGIGMPQEQLALIFKPFSQADSGINRKFGGTGLGLAICWDIVKVMGSCIEVTSQYGQGSEFSFSLEFDVIEKEQEKAKKSDLAFAVCSLNDDENKIKSSVKNYLEKIGNVFELSENMNKKANFLFCFGGTHLSMRFNDFKQHNPESKIVFVGEKKELETSSLQFVDYCLDLPIYGSKIYNIIADNSTLHNNVLKNSTANEQFQAKVLVAEDNLNNQKLIDILLKKLGIDVTIVSNGQEAIDKYTQEKFDLILMDINMPILDGISATKAINALQEEKQSNKVPIIALTANSIAGDKEKYLQEGMSDYLSKPIEFDKLVTLLKSYLKNPLRHTASKEVQTMSSKTLCEFLGVPPKIAFSFFESFKDEILNDLKELNEYLVDENKEKFIQKVHSIKSSCLVMNLTQEVKLLEKIEKEEMTKTHLAEHCETLRRGITLVIEA